jgi:CRP-like cAMP-binding protein
MERDADGGVLKTQGNRPALRSLFFFLMIGQKKHVFTEKRKVLAARTLAQKIGYLRTRDFHLFTDKLPTRLFNAHRIIRPKDELFVVLKGVVEIWYAHHDILVTELKEGTVFGDMPLLGQTMLGCQAIAGLGGVAVGIMNVELITEFIKTNPVRILQELGPRLAFVEGEHYRTAFQTVDSRLAGLLLELAGSESIVKGFTHEELGEQVGSYRETVTNILDAMESDKLIEVARKRITLLDKRALRELSEL